MSDSDITTGSSAVRATMDDGATILLRRFGTGDERVVISHGNGLAIDGFASFAQALVARGFEVVAFDLRNHGHNPFHPQDEPNWLRFIRDFPAILRAMDA